MGAIIKNLAIDQGTDFSIRITQVDTDLREYNIVSQIRANASPAHPILAIPTIVKVIPDEPPLEDPPLPLEKVTEFDIVLTAEQTNKLPVTGKNYTTLTTFAYDVIGIAPDGNTIRIVHGIVTVSPAVTR